MTNNRDEETKKMLELFNKLPRNVQNAVIWMIINFDELEELLKKPLSPESREQLMEKAERNNDAYLLVLCAAEQAYNAHMESLGEK